jgi:hypothetical protein
LLNAACARPSSENPAPATGGTYVQERCPVSASAPGYPLIVVGADRYQLDAAWLVEWARVAAYRWQVPSRRRSHIPGVHQVRSRILPAAPRWADDWKPDTRHQAEFLVTAHRDRAPDGFVLSAKSGDDLFDRSLETMIGDPLPASPEFPRLPAGSPDAVRLRVRLGKEPAAGEGVGLVRFARQQRPVRLVPGTLEVRGGTRDHAVVAYDVGVDGRVIPGALQIVAASRSEFARAVEAGLYRARFTPAQEDCAPIKLTVVQTFGS